QLAVRRNIRAVDVDACLDPLPAFDLVVAQIPLEHAHQARRATAEDHARGGVAREDRFDAGGRRLFAIAFGHGDWSPAAGVMFIQSRTACPTPGCPPS